MARFGASSPRRYKRTDRVAEVLREVVADELERVDDERLGLVAVTGVHVHPELETAVVLFSTLGDETVVAEALEGHRARLQKAVAKQVRAKRTPVLSFAADPAVLAGRRVDELLKEHPAREGEVPVDLASYRDLDDDDA